MPAADKWLESSALKGAHQETLGSLLGDHGYHGTRSYNVERGQRRRRHHHLLPGRSAFRPDNALVHGPYHPDPYNRPGDERVGWVWFPARAYLI